MADVLPDPGHLSIGIEKDLPVHGFRKEGFLGREPPVRRQQPVRGPGPVPEKVRGPDHTLSGPDGPDQGPAAALELPGELFIGPFQEKGPSPVHRLLSRQKEEKAGLEVMVPGNVVVKAKAFGPGPAQARRQKGQKVRKVFLQHGPSISLKVGPGQLQSLHLPPP